MKLKTKSLIILFFSILILTSIFFISNVNAYFGAVVLETDKDTYIESGSEADSNFNSMSYISTGYPYHITKALIGFNITGLIEAYQYGYFDNDVHLRFYYRSMTSGGTVFDWRIYRITEDWNVSTVTWNTAPNITSLLYNYTITKTEIWSTYEYCYLDIHDDFQQVLEENVDFYGYMIYCSGFTSNWQVQWNNEESETYMGTIVYGYDEDEEEEEEEYEVTASLMVDFFMYGIFFIAIPLTITVYVGGIHNPSLGMTSFIATETLMGAIALSIGLISIWFMTVIIIVDVIIIIAMLKYR